VKKSIWTLLFILIFLLSTLACNALTPSPPPEELLQRPPGWTTFTNTNYVSAMAFDHEGNLWAGGDGGVIRWDVKKQIYARYTTLDGLASNRVQSIAVAPDGAIWFGTYAGLSRFNGQSWATYGMNDSPTFISMPSLTVNSTGAVWAVVGGTHLYRFEGQTWFPQAEFRSPTAIAQASDGTLWTNNLNYLSRFDGENWTGYDAISVLPEYGPAGIASIEVLAAAPDGVWSTSRDTGPGQVGLGVFRFDGQLWTTYTTQDGLADNNVHAAVIASDGSAWFATDAGVSRFDGYHWTTYDEDHGLPSNNVSSIVESPDGELWVGMADAGVARFDGEAWISYRTDDYLGPNSVKTVAIDTTGGLWLGTDNGVHHFDGETWTHYTEEDGLSSNVVTSLALAPDGTLWAGSANCCILCPPPRGGLSHFDGQNWTTFTEAGDCRFSVTVDANNVAWFTELWGGVYSFDGETLRKYETEEKFSSLVTAIAVAPDGAIWVGNTWGDIGRLDGDVWTLFTDEIGLHEQSITSILATPAGDIWVGTVKGGVYHFDGETWTTFSAEHGLADNTVYGMAVAPNGAVWFATASGLSEFDGEVWTTHLPHDSMTSATVSRIAFGPDGVLWGSCWASCGLLRYVPEK